MLSESLKDLDETYLKRICSEKLPESQTLEFKRELPGFSDADKRELQKDVCALANAAGGDLIYGISEGNGTGSADSIASITTESADAAVRRIMQVLDSGLEPRVQGIQSQIIQVQGGYVLAFRIPASFDGPHCVWFNNTRRFILRNGTLSSDMTYEQIRSAFDRTASLAEKAKEFIAARRDLVASRSTVSPIQDGPVLLVHVAPIEGLANRRAIDLRKVSNGDYSDLTSRTWRGASQRFSFDGLTVHPGGDTTGGYVAYTHIFRNGTIEAAQVGGEEGRIPGESSKKFIVWAEDMSTFFYEMTEKLVKSARRHGFEGPAVAGYSLLSTGGYELGVGDAFYRFGRVSADRANFVLPEVWIEDLSSVNVSSLTRQALDTLWQSFGFDHCPHFDEKTGVFWITRR